MGFRGYLATSIVASPLSSQSLHPKFFAVMLFEAGFLLVFSGKKGGTLKVPPFAQCRNFSFYCILSCTVVLWVRVRLPALSVPLKVSVKVP